MYICICMYIHIYIAKDVSSQQKQIRSLSHTHLSDTHPPLSLCTYRRNITFFPHTRTRTRTHTHTLQNRIAKRCVAKTAARFDHSECEETHAHAQHTGSHTHTRAHQNTHTNKHTHTQTYKYAHKNTRHKNKNHPYSFT